MSVAIKVDSLSKCYLIGHHKQGRYPTLRDALVHKARGMAQRIIHPLSPNREMIRTEEFWALKNINLEIREAERVGIIGRNGAGKSTLLKILSRITSPTKGSFMTNGRVASLLEVGTGFHPELTGRENIYLNGAVLGMSKKEISRKFDEIVAFAEVEKFLDTPVKRYSSGMYVRLAFSVAAHLDSEILIVDEVLAVGDLNFQQKCIRTMNRIGHEGRTVIVVSHNMGVIEKLSERCIYLSKGRIAASGPAVEIIEQYQKESLDSSQPGLPSEFDDIDRQPVTKISNPVLTNGTTSQSANLFKPGDPMTLKCLLEAEESVENAVVCMRIYQNDMILLGNNSEHMLGKFELRKGDKKEVKVNFEALMLLPGAFTLVVFVLPSYFSQVNNTISNVCTLEFIIQGSRKFGGGHVYLRQSWSIE